MIRVADRIPSGDIVESLCAHLHLEFDLNQKCLWRRLFIESRWMPGFNQIYRKNLIVRCLCISVHAIEIVECLL